MQLRYIAAGVLCCIALLVAAPSAFGASAAQQGYTIPGGSIEQQVGGSCTNPNECEPGRTSHEPVAEVHEASKLPFTGLDIGLVVAAGGVLLAMGFGIRRLSRSEV
jgi:hypothetical protein